MVISRPESASWIEILRLGWKWNVNYRTRDFDWPPPPAEGQRGLMDIVSDLFIRSTHLRVFRANSVKIPSEMYRHIFRLPSLRSIKCYQSWVADEPTDYDSFHTQDLGLESLDIATYTYEGSVDRATVWLARSPRLRALTTPLFFFNRSIDQPPHTYHTLFDLTITLVGDAPADRFIGALAACPNLRSIRVYGAYPQQYLQNGILEVPGSVAPLLNKVEMHFPLAKFFIPGRPVESVLLNPPFPPANPTSVHWSQDVLLPLTLGSTPIKELSLQGHQWTQDGMDAIFKSFPSLESLKVHFLGDHDTVPNNTVSFNSRPG